jgi:hypothetical protein
MSGNDLTEEQKKLVGRYVELWRRFRQESNGDRCFAKLEDDLAEGSGMFLCGLLVQAEASTVITADVQDPNFHTAIFGNDDSAVTDMTPDELQEARRYIVQGEGEAPVRWWAKPPVPALGTDTGKEGGPPSNPPVAA